MIFHTYVHYVHVFSTVLSVLGLPYVVISYHKNRKLGLLKQPTCDYCTYVIVTEVDDLSHQFETQLSFMRSMNNINVVQTGGFPK